MKSSAENEKKKPRAAGVNLCAGNAEGQPARIGLRMARHFLHCGRWTDRRAESGDVTGLVANPIDRAAKLLASHGAIDSALDQGGGLRGDAVGKPVVDVTGLGPAAHAACQLGL